MGPMCKLCGAYPFQLFGMPSHCRSFELALPTSHQLSINQHLSAAACRALKTAEERVLAFRYGCDCPCTGESVEGGGGVHGRGFWHDAMV